MRKFLLTEVKEKLEIFHLHIQNYQDVSAFQYIRSRYDSVQNANKLSIVWSIP